MLFVQLTPFPTLRTPRLLLRQFVPADAEALRFFRSDPEFLRYVPREPEPTLEHAQAHLALLDKLLTANEGIAWALSRPGHPTELLGSICLWNVQPAHYRAEVGYGLHPTWAGQGLMSEALAAVVRFGVEQLGLHSLEAQLDPANAASIRLLEKQGFRPEGLFRENHCFRGQFLDTAVYSLLAAHWRAQAGAELFAAG